MITLEEAGAAKMSGKKNICQSCAHSKVRRFNDGELSEYCNQYLAISALRPISREQVEKVWRGWWIILPYTELYKNKCSNCGKGSDLESDFCPHCGTPMTDEAVEMVIERLEEFHGQENP